MRAVAGRGQRALVVRRLSLKGASGAGDGVVTLAPTPPGQKPLMELTSP